MPLSLIDLEKGRIGDSFFSRKNSVFRSHCEGRDVVVKVYADNRGDSALKEYSVLETCRKKDVAAPIPLRFEDTAIMMEYVEGLTLGEFLDTVWHEGNGSRNTHRNSVEDIAVSLGDWLAGFHAAFSGSLSRGDANIRNFIIGRKGVVGIDFEESGESEVIDDLGQACSSILSMHPKFSQEKADFCRCMVKAYSSKAREVESIHLSDAIARALEYYAEFRSDGDELIRKAAEIRRNGL